jgi:hypothetical protein
MTLEQRHQRLRQCILHYEMANGWLMALAWIPKLPEWVCDAIVGYYVRKADRKAKNMHVERVYELLRDP